MDLRVFAFPDKPEVPGLGCAVFLRRSLGRAATRPARGVVPRAHDAPREGLDEVERYADVVATQVQDLDGFVLVGDSFGAVISLTLALRRPSGLRALVLSGGFAANPLPRWRAVLRTTFEDRPIAMARCGSAPTRSPRSSTGTPRFRTP